MIHIMLYPRYCHRTFEQNMDIPNYGVYIYIHIHIYIYIHIHIYIYSRTNALSVVKQYCFFKLFWQFLSLKSHEVLSSIPFFHSEIHEIPMKPQLFIVKHHEVT